MREPRPVVIALMIDEHLGLVLEAAKSGAVNDAVAVALEARPRPALWLGVQPAATLLRSACIGGKHGRRHWLRTYSRGAARAIMAATVPTERNLLGFDKIRRLLT
jgi:hypothetical protein